MSVFGGVTRAEPMMMPGGMTSERAMVGRWITWRWRGEMYRARCGEVMGVKTVLAWAAVVFVVYYVFTAPDGAAHVVDVAFGWLKGAANSLGTFLNHVKL
jgi:hypothetical protein